MLTRWFRLTALAVVGAAVLSIPSAEAHFWVPVHNGVKWAQACRPENLSRITPATCCDHSGFYCSAACGLVDIDDGWKAQCRASCEAARAVCQQNVAHPQPPLGVDPRRPPARTY